MKPDNLRSSFQPRVAELYAKRRPLWTPFLRISPLRHKIPNPANAGCSDEPGVAWLARTRNEVKGGVLAGEPYKKGTPSGVPFLLAFSSPKPNLFHNESGQSEITCHKKEKAGYLAGHIEANERTERGGDGTQIQITGHPGLYLFLKVYLSTIDSFLTSITMEWKEDS